jgi:hypothetical protein
MSIRRSNRLMARLEKAAAEEEAPQGRGHGRGRGRPPGVEELWELEAGVPEHRHRRPMALRLKLNMEEPSKTSLSQTNLHHPHLTWWT